MIHGFNYGGFRAGKPLLEQTGFEAVVLLQIRDGEEGSGAGWGRDDGALDTASSATAVDK